MLKEAYLLMNSRQDSVVKPASLSRRKLRATSAV